MAFKWTIGPDTVLTFPSKPSADIRKLLAGAGFRWSASGYWWRRGVKGAADFIAALQKRLEPDKPDGDCWTCGEPGKFRPEGAATPVYCDECHTAHKAVQAERRLSSDGRVLAHDDPSYL